MANKPFGDSDRVAVEAWVQKQLNAGKSLRAIRMEARKKFGAFDWDIIINLILELIKAWLIKK